MVTGHSDRSNFILSFHSIAECRLVLRTYCPMKGLLKYCNPVNCILQVTLDEEFLAN